MTGTRYWGSLPVGAEKCAEYTQGESSHLGLGVFVPQPTQFREICLGFRAITFYLFSRSTKILKDSVFQTVSLNPVVTHEINLTSQDQHILKVE